MSQEPTTPNLVELLRRADEAAERRDWDAVMSIFMASGPRVSVDQG